MEYIAHKEGGREQTVRAHLCGTAERAERFASVFGAGAEGARCGFLHDIGKYSQAFQRRIRGGQNRVDHSTAGALEAKKRKDTSAAFCVAGHHGGLTDMGGPAALPGTLMHRISKEYISSLPDYGAFRQEIEIPEAAVPELFLQNAYARQFFTRMLYSCLVDADYLDTEAFVRNGVGERGGFPAMEEYIKRLDQAIAPWLNAPEGSLNRLRTEILRAAIESGAWETGFFTFTAPTGSGKTIASLAFALAHLKRRKHERIIYVIPYCSIIEQTQEEFERIFGEGSVVAHYANVEYKSGEEETERDQRRLAAENWDAPIILTTAVQFFESLYANKPSRCRKLHNLANSVIIFDEAQMLPLPLLRPCVRAICELTAHYGCTAVLCTATQPALSGLIREWLPACELREICPRPEEMYAAFRRVRYENLGKISDDALISRLPKRALCVVNSRAHAQKLYDMLPKEGRFYLTTTLCAAHRREILKEIRRRLDKKLPCRVISTSLIEAGVDVDFPEVYRELAGLDSIIQSGGRCNREGAPGTVNGAVYIFESEKGVPGDLLQNISSAREVLGVYSDIAAPEAVEAYFNDLYALRGGEAMDSGDTLKMCESANPSFKSVAEAFKMINSAQRTVYIPCAENQELIARLAEFGPSRSLMRLLGPYAVGVCSSHFERLAAGCHIDLIAENAGILRNMELYHADTGLELTTEEGAAILL